MGSCTKTCQKKAGEKFMKKKVGIWKYKIQYELHQSEKTISFHDKVVVFNSSEEGIRIKVNVKV